MKYLILRMSGFGMTTEAAENMETESVPGMAADEDKEKEGEDKK